MFSSSTNKFQHPQVNRYGRKPTPEKLNFNTVGKYIQFVKTIVYDAKNHDFNINSEIEKKEFKPIREKTTFVTLSENEIDLIFNHNFLNVNVNFFSSFQPLLAFVCFFVCNRWKRLEDGYNLLYCMLS